MPTITIWGKVRQGQLVLPKRFVWPPAADIEITMHTPPSQANIDAALRCAGAWKDQVDCEQLSHDIYASRRRGLTGPKDRPYPESNSPSGRKAAPQGKQGR